MPSRPVDAQTADRRLLLVHAHPDDETINHGVTMARYVAEGASVTLVTCTQGELGEVLVPELEHLAFERDGGLGRHRVGELTEAMAALGVSDHRWLGGPARYHDSGMVWDASGSATVAPDVPPGAFWLADLTEAADLLVETIRELRPQVLVTYDEKGGYGHPDHVQAHRVAMYASLLAAAPSYRPDLGPAWDIAKIYWVASLTENWMRAALRWLRAAGDTTTFEGMEPDGPLPSFVIADELLTTRIDSPEHVPAKLAALRSYPTQIAVDGPILGLGEDMAQKMWGSEFHRLVKGTPGPPDETGLETDLFAGLQ
ncbi:MAG TPA: N-acetyl-1-D-myo-inositol-2-amino-2-deoxy-alpha-D-glucopyranoside deacetylase [Nocardioidaceae bacterium]|nr:N-acetyl-1-D-myo-inositol-2-amino-2-deoxy-alpha-D-glucopyranoside deacetylase [Nocardioidaceae bacterium]